jgi:hypothetical protein
MRPATSTIQREPEAKTYLLGDLIMNMTDFVNSNYIKGEDIAQNVLIEATIASVKRKEFEDSEKSVIALEDGRQVVLNQTRLKVLIGAFGPNSENWIGKPVILSRGQERYGGKSVPAVRMEPIVAPRIAAAGSAQPLHSPQPVQITRGSSDIQSGPAAWDDPPPAPPPPDRYEGPDDDIDF